jgi:hypothetical protein
MEGINVFYRMLAGAVGGGAGSLIIFLGVLLFGSILSQFMEDSQLSSPIATFLIIIVLFFATLIANSLGAFLIGLTDPDKYTNLSKGLLQILLVNVVIFVFTLPVYFVVKSIDPFLTFYVAAVHFLFSAMTSGLVFNIIAVDREQILVNVYSIVLGVFSGLLLLVLLYMAAGEMLLFFSMPIIIWFSIGFVGGTVEYFYYQLYRHSGVDFLQTEDLKEEDLEQEGQEKDNQSF